MAKGKRGANAPLEPPEWVWQLPRGTYKPEHEWDMLLIGYDTWHVAGAKVPGGKGQSPDYKNWGVTLPSVALSLRRYDEAHNGGVVPRDPLPYWTAVIMAGAAVICRLRAIRYITEAEAAVTFDLPDKDKKIKRAKRYFARCEITRCPRFYVDKLPAMPELPDFMKGTEE